MFLSADFETTFYDFESMENDFPTEASSLLLYHAGISVDMHYSSYGSGASVCWDSNSAQSALDSNFNYNDDITINSISLAKGNNSAFSLNIEQILARIAICIYIVN